MFLNRARFAPKCRMIGVAENGCRKHSQNFVICDGWSWKRAIRQLGDSFENIECFWSSRLYYKFLYNLSICSKVQYSSLSWFKAMSMGTFWIKLSWAWLGTHMWILSTRNRWSGCLNETLIFGTIWRLELVRKSDKSVSLYRLYGSGCIA